jgi:hypothetical protein
MFGHVSTERVSRGPDLSQGARLVAHPPCPQHHDQNLKTGPNCVARMMKRWLCNAVRPRDVCGDNAKCAACAKRPGDRSMVIASPALHASRCNHSVFEADRCVDLQKCYPVKLGEALSWCCVPLLRRTAVRVGCRAWRSFAQMGEGSTKCRFPAPSTLDAGSLGLRSPVRSNSAVLVRSLQVFLTCQLAFPLLERQSLYARLPSLACVWACPWQPPASQSWLPYVPYCV